MRTGLLFLFFSFLLSTFSFSQKIKELSCSELKNKEAAYVEDYENRRDQEINRLQSVQEEVKKQIQNSQINWGGTKRVNQEISMVDNDYRSMINQRKSYWEARLKALAAHFQPLHESCYEPRPQYLISGSWTIVQTNGYRGTLTMNDNGNGTFNGTAQFNNNLRGNIINGTVKGDQVTFRIDYGSFYGDYSGVFKEGGNMIEEQGGTTQSSTGEKASWTAKRQ